MPSLEEQGHEFTIRLLRREEAKVAILENMLIAARGYLPRYTDQLPDELK